jgi:membrane fusion protein (multidrug efflux system)
MDTSFQKEYVAQIQSLQNVEIRANEKGYLESINVDEGSQVKAGQVLFKIMPKEYEAELLKAKAIAKSAEIECQNAKTLADKNIVSNAELAMAQSKFDEAKAEVALAQLHVSFTEIKAPFDGTIDRIRFKTGSLIDEGTLLTTLSNNKEVYAYFNVSEIEYLDYKNRNKNNVKDVATLILANNQPHKYKGSIETIEGEFDNTTGNIAFQGKISQPRFIVKTW